MAWGISATRSWGAAAEIQISAPSSWASALMSRRRVAAQGVEVQAFEDQHLELRTGALLEPDGLAELRGVQLARRIDTDVTVAVDVDVHRRFVFEMRRGGELFEDGVVVGADVGDRVVHRDVEHVAGAEQLVERHPHQHRALADAVTREHDAHVAGAESPVQPLLEEPQRASRVQEFSVQAITLPCRCSRRGNPR